MSRRHALLSLAVSAGLLLSANPTGLTSAGATAGATVSAGPVAATSAATSAAAQERRLSNGCRFGPRGLPTCGAYLGASHGGNDDPAALERMARARLGVHRTYYRGDQVDWAVETARADLRLGRLPWISFKLPLSWADMASGKGDAWARGLATRLARLPGPVWVAFHHEPEGDGNLADWRRMQERLAPIVRHTARNVAYTVILTGWNQLYGASEYSLARIWPRHTKVDVAGFDVYNEFGVEKHGATIKTWPKMGTDYYGPLQRWARRHHVAWGLAETGVTNEGYRRSPGWIGQSFQAMRAHDGVAFAYFDSPLNTDASYELGTGAKARSFTSQLTKGARLPRA